MEHLSLSRSVQRQGSKVTCSVWGAEKAYTPRQVNSGHGKWMGHHSRCDQILNYKQCFLSTVYVYV